MIWALRDIWRPVRTDVARYRSPGVQLDDVTTSIHPPSLRDVPRRTIALLAVGAVMYAAVVFTYFRLPDSVQLVFVGILGFAAVATVVWRVADVVSLR